MSTKEIIASQIIEAVRQVRQTKPLAGSITNGVTINFVANAQLAVGGSAAMVNLPDEGETLAQAGGATYINVGLLLPIYEETLPRTARTLYELQKPWVLDPVAIGIGSLRTKLLRQFKEYKPSIIRGNASEIIALANLWELTGEAAASKVRGVDTTEDVQAAQGAAMALASWTGGAVAVSGETDLITDGTDIVLARGGSPCMERITGAGCSLGGVMAVYAAVATPFVAAITGSAIYNLAGQRAATKVDGPGHFQAAFLDELYKATAEEIGTSTWEIQ